MATPSVDLPTRTGITVDEYRQMIDTGQIGEDDRVELLNGEIVDQMTKHPPHLKSMKRLNRLFFNLLPKEWHHQTQDPIVLTASMPEPDLAVLRGTEDDYDERIPGATDVGLVIEVAESSLAKDRKKASIYAEGNLPHYWIVNLLTHCIEVDEQPTVEESEACYSSVESFHSGEKVPLRLGGQLVCEVPVDQMLP